MAVTAENVTLWFAEAVLPLERQLAAESAEQFLSEIGLPNPDVVAQRPAVKTQTAHVVTEVGKLVALIPDLAAAIENHDLGATERILLEAAPAVENVVTAIKDLADAIDSVAGSAGTSEPEVRAFAAQLPERLFGYLLVVHLRRTFPTLHDAAVVLGIVEVSQIAKSGDTPAHVRRTLHWDRLGAVVNDPVQVMADVYGWGTATFDWDLMRRRLFNAIAATGFAFAGVQSARPSLRIPLVDVDPSDGAIPGLRATTRAGVAADTSFSRPISDAVSWEASSDGEIESATSIELLPPATFRVIPPSREIGGEVSIGIKVADPAGTQTLLLGSAAGAYVAGKSLAAVAGAELEWQPAIAAATGELVAYAAITDGRVVLDLRGADSFVKALLPEQSTVIDFDLRLAWSHSKGLHVEGGAGPEIDLPVNVQLGVVRVVSIRIAVKASPERLAVDTSGSVAARLGPVGIVVDRIGASTALSVPDGGGNLGVADLRTTFRPPDGIGVAIDAKLIRGGGFLRFEEETGEYTGVLELSFKGLTVKALGLLNTRAPEAGWSLLLLLYAEFRETPWQLGLGFNITAVGGIIGLQHAASVEQLRSSLGTTAFDDVLFPDDPVKDAPRILGRLRTLFPVEARALTLGPVVELNWATPPLVRARLAILAQFSGAFGGGSFGFTRLTVLGTVRATAPSATIDAPRLADLTADVLGDYDVESGLLAIDARLRDSRLGGVEFSGSLIVRIGLGRNPAFAVAAGGFHPGFVDLPPALPARIDRLGLVWKLGDSVVLTLQAYAAVTASSWQLGALFTLRAEIGPVDIDGALGFDAIAYDDGRFSVTIGGHVKIRWRGHTLMAVSITVTLDRNARQVWHAAGTASFSVLWWDKEVDFEHTWGTEQSLPPAKLVDAKALIRTGLADPGNWTSQLPAGGDSLVALTDPQRAPGAVWVRVLAHPLGTLTVTQRAAPLGLRLDYVDGAPVAPGTIVEIGSVTVGQTAAAATPPTTQMFARARFQELSENERLTQRTFEAFSAGVAITPEGQANPVGAVTDFDFERIFLAPDSVKKPPPVKSFPGQPGWHIRTGPASRSPLREAGRLVRGVAARDVAVRPPPVVLVGDRDLVEAVKLSEVEACSATLARQRLRAGQLVVEAHEVGV